MRQPTTAICYTIRYDTIEEFNMQDLLMVNGNDHRPNRPIGLAYYRSPYGTTMADPNRNIHCIGLQSVASGLDNAHS